MNVNCTVKRIDIDGVIDIPPEFKNDHHEITKELEKYSKIKNSFPTDIPVKFLVNKKSGDQLIIKFDQRLFWFEFPSAFENDVKTLLDKPVSTVWVESERSQLFSLRRIINNLYSGVRSLLLIPNDTLTEVEFSFIDRYVSVDRSFNGPFVDFDKENIGKNS